MTSRRPTFHINVVTGVERSQAIDDCKAAILNHRGNIIDFKMFSNLSICFIVELSTQGVLAMSNELRELGWKVSHQFENRPEREDGAESIEGTLQLTFAQGDGEMRIVVPDVPG